jgi:hypothetical protein
MPTIDEKELEDYLMEPGNLQRLELFEEMDYAQRQVNLGAYGIADIISIQPGIPEVHDADYCITVIELKRDDINVSTLMQACRYLGAIKQFIEGFHKGKYVRFETKIVLVGRNINVNDWTYLGHQFSNVAIWTYSLDLETGISFENHRLEDYEIPGAQPPTAFVSRFRDLIEPTRIKIVSEYQAQKDAAMAAKALPAPEEVQVEEVHG